ncbi:MAG: hypothetical protein DME23_27190 [Verrucomicrobia bacterium]|nr:MAG: hypothetical protein DME23_27190 [Verrucomicrobiota bacterium]
MDPNTIAPEQRRTQRLVDWFNADERLWQLFRLLRCFFEGGLLYLRLERKTAGPIAPVWCLALRRTGVAFWPAGISDYARRRRGMQRSIR